jgi:CxxC motif-containing protein
MDQSVKIQLGQGETSSVKTGRGVSKHLTVEALQGCGDFKIAGHVIHTVK